MVDPILTLVLPISIYRNQKLTFINALELQEDLKNDSRQLQKECVFVVSVVGKQKKKQMYVTENIWETCSREMEFNENLIRNFGKTAGKS